MAQYIREEILTLLELDKDTFNTLTKEPLNKPMGNWPIVKYVRGKLLGNNHELAAKENAYPFLIWKTLVNKCEVTEDGKINIEHSEKFTPVLGEGIEISQVSYEAWKPE